MNEEDCEGPRRPTNPAQFLKMAEVANGSPSGLPASQTSVKENDPPGSMLIDLDPSLVLVSGHSGDPAAVPSPGVSVPAAAVAAATAAATTATTGEAAQVLVADDARGAAAGRLLYDRPRSRKLNRTSSNQCHVDMAGWLQAFPHMTMEDLGPGFSTDSFINSQGLKIATYAWRQQQKQQPPTAAVVLFHSYTSYALFDFLRHQPPDSNSNNTNGNSSSSNGNCSSSGQAPQQLQEEPNWVPKFRGRSSQL